MAWAIILRPSQKFMKTKKEENAFLEGYSKYCSFNVKTFNWCKTLIYLDFYHIGKKCNDTEYMKYVLKEMRSCIRE